MNREPPGAERSSLENRLPKRHGGSNPSSCAKKIRTLLVGVLYFLPQSEGDELSFAKRNGEFAYRRHRANLEAQSIRGICVARRCRLKFIPKRNGFNKPCPEQHTPLPAPRKELKSIDFYTKICYNGFVV